MKRIFNLGTVAWPGAAGPTPVNLAPIPDKYMSDSYRVARLVLEFTVNIDVTGTNSWDGIEMAAWITNYYLRAAEETLVNISGLSLAVLLDYSHIYGLAAPLIAPNQAGILDDAVVSWTVEIPLENLPAASPQDFVVPASLFNDAELIITWGGQTPATGVTINSAQCVVWTQVERKNEIQIPAFPFILSLLDKASANLTPGIYTELLAMTEDKADFVAADVTTVMMMANGETIHGAINANALRACYCWDHGMPDTGYYGGGDTDFGDGALSNVLPLIWPANNPASNRISQFVDTGGTPLDLTVQGAEANLHFVMRGYRPITAEGSAIKLGRMGAATPELLAGKRKTMSKVICPATAIRTRNALRILPTKIQGAQNQESLGTLASRFDPPDPQSGMVLKPR